MTPGPAQRPRRRQEYGELIGLYLVALSSVIEVTINKISSTQAPLSPSTGSSSDKHPAMPSSSLMQSEFRSAGQCHMIGVGVLPRSHLVN